MKSLLPAMVFGEARSSIKLYGIIPNQVLKIVKITAKKNIEPTRIARLYLALPASARMAVVIRV